MKRSASASTLNRPGSGPARVTEQKKDRDPVKSVGVCEKTAGWDAITVTNVAGPRTQNTISRPTRTGSRERESGATVRLDSNFRCTRVDTSEANGPDGAVRQPRCELPRHVRRDSQRLGQGRHGLVACAKTDAWDAITAKGVGCGEVEDELEEYGDELLNAGIDGEAELETAYQCKRLDSSEAEGPDGLLCQRRQDLPRQLRQARIADNRPTGSRAGTGFWLLYRG